jgi:hypothetical protein
MPLRGADEGTAVAMGIFGFVPSASAMPLIHDGGLPEQSETLRCRSWFHAGADRRLPADLPRTASPYGDGKDIIVRARTSGPRQGSQGAHEASDPTKPDLLKQAPGRRKPYRAPSWNLVLRPGLAAHQWSTSMSRIPVAVAVLAMALLPLTPTLAGIATSP